MSVPDILSRLRMVDSESDSYENVVETPFELCKQIFAGDAFLANRAFKIRSELVLQHAVDALHFLFFAQLQPVSDDLRFTIVTVLPWREIPFFNPARRLETAFPFEEQLHSFPAA